MDDKTKKDIEKAFEGLERLEKEIEQDEQEVEEIEAELQSEEKQTETAEQKEAHEIEDGEEKGSTAEIEDAEQKEQKILDMLKSQEDLVDRAIRDIEEELKDEAGEEQQFEREAAAIRSGFKEAIQELKYLFKEFRQLDKSDKDVASQDLNELNQVLNDLQFEAKALHQLFQHQYRFLNELEETEKEEFRLENLEEELLKELEMDKTEVDELLKDSKMIKNRHDVSLAGKEESELENLMNHWRVEEEEIEKIDAKIETEVEELKSELEKNREIIELSGQALGMLERLEEQLKDERGMLNFMIGGNIDRQLDQIDSTVKQLEKMYSREKGEEEALENESKSAASGAKKVLSNIPTGPGAKRTAALGVKVVAAAVVLFFIIAEAMY